jgi:hypothetical protein
MGVQPETRQAGSTFTIRACEDVLEQNSCDSMLKMCRNHEFTQR